MSDPLTFESLNPSSPYVDTVVRWIYTEWSKENGDSEEEIGTKLFQDQDVPPSQVALYKNSLAGFVWISRFTKPEDDDPTLWINGLYVDKPFRRQGIGQALIRIAEHLSEEFEDSLFAYTNIPGYYLKSGWSINKERDEKNNAVVVRKIN